MLRRSIEQPPVVPELSDEQRSLMVTSAHQRIEDIDGVEYLDGYKIPPDNEELFNNNVYSFRYMRIGWFPDENGGYQFGTKETIKEVPSSLTNSRARNSNIYLIAIGSRPLYIKPEDQEPYAPIFEPREPLLKRVASKLTSLLANK